MDFMRVVPLCRYRCSSLVVTKHTIPDVVSKLFSDVKQEKIAELPFSSLKGMKGGRFKPFFRPLNQKDCRVIPLDSLKEKRRSSLNPFPTV